MRKFYIALILACMALNPVAGQNKLSPLLRQTLSESAAVASPLDGSMIKPAKVTRAGETYISAFVRFNDQAAIDSLETYGAIIRTKTKSFVTAFIPVNAIEKAAELAAIDYIEMGSPVTQLLDEAKEASNANQMLQGTGLPQAFNGEGVVLGVIDNGFEYTHPNFYDGERNNYRIKRVWQQLSSGDGPEGYDYGKEMTSQEEILEAGTDASGATHGTHVLGIAAGADQTYDYAGIAQASDIVLVALDGNDIMDGDNTKVIDAINYIFDYADEQGKPVVINMSLGSSIGPRDGTSSFDQMCDELLGEGKILVGAFGNDGGSTCHTSMTFSGEGDDELKVLYEFTYTSTLASYTEIWGEEGMDLTITPVAVQQSNGSLAYQLEPLTISADNDFEDQKSYTFGSLSGTYTVTAEINPLNNKPHFFITVYFSSSINYHLGFHLTSESQGTVHVWTENVYSVIGNNGVEGYAEGDDLYTGGELGGTGNRIISVGAYVTRDYYEQSSVQYKSGETLGELASFSSHGPRVDGRMKPEISAPSSYIISSVSSYNTAAPRIRSNINIDGTRYYFGYMQGTSMASPFVAGVVAAWLQAKPDLTPEEAKEFMQASAINDEFTGDIKETGDNDWGYGKIDAYEGVKLCLGYDGSGIGSNSAHSLKPVIVKNNDGYATLLFTTQMTNATITLLSTDGKNIMTTKANSIAAGEEIDLKLHQCSPGIYLISVQSNECQRQTEKLVVN